jgi:hypothetical protein
MAIRWLGLRILFLGLGRVDSGQGLTGNRRHATASPVASARRGPGMKPAQAVTSRAEIVIGRRRASSRKDGRPGMRQLLRLGRAASYIL